MYSVFTKSLIQNALIGCIIGLAVLPAGSDAANPLKVIATQQENTVADENSRSIQDEINGLTREIMEMRRSRSETEAAAADITTDYTDAQIGKLTAIKSKLEQIHSETKKKDEYLREAALLGEKLELPIPDLLSTSPPYPIDYYDRLLDDLSHSKQQTKSLSSAIGVAKRTIELALSNLEKMEKAWRNAKEDASEEEEGIEALALSAEAKLRWLDVRLAKISVDFEKTRLERLSTELQLGVTGQELLTRQIEWVRKNLKFEKFDLDRQIQKLDVRRNQLKASLKQVFPKLTRTENLLIEIRDKLTAAKNIDEERTLEARLKTLNTWRETYQIIFEQTESMIRLSEQQETVWKHRYLLLNGQKSTESLKNWTEGLTVDNKQIANNITFQQNSQNNLLLKISSLESQLTEEAIGSAIKKQLQERLKAFQTMSGKRSEYLAYLLDTLLLNQQMLEEISDQVDTLPLSTQLYELLDKAGDLWEFEVWVIDDRPVTIRKIVIAFLILIIGLVAVKYLIRVAGKRLRQVPHLQATAASTIQKVFSYLAYLLVVLFALRMVNIPLAAFAFLGGAIAIGFGFGAQNLINNFISGFIIMGERPINIGDLIEVDGLLGMVEEIGTRCTRIRTGENIDILVPNSSFLEKNITNWTLKDRRIRTQITIGVAYGSPIEKVEQLLLECVTDLDKILKSPKPFVLFRDFGDNALIFEVYFWISIRRIVERRIIESSVRFRIDHKFKESGITIAFPQRDLHLDTQTPLKLRILGESNDLS